MAEASIYIDPAPWGGYTVSGLDQNGDSPMDSFDVELKKDAVKEAKAIARDMVKEGMDNVVVLFDGNEIAFYERK